MKIFWSDRAISDLAEIRDYIAEDSPAAAGRVLERIFSVVENLALFPDQGRQVPEAEDLPDVRELLVDSYRVIYRRRSSEVEVASVVHARRDLPRIDPRPW
ncbi:MAG: type II toxin-antitoxin system RelE/ParE family toxin [Acidobacteria bacterium]|nr:type II toxin-antitoxin system RelE/ParE family toxin [Acidobacteriota bacterium]